MLLKLSPIKKKKLTKYMIENLEIHFYDIRRIIISRRTEEVQISHTFHSKVWSPTLYNTAKQGSFKQFWQ